jgi:DUF4097 and DUF4098 domain-containing protein YvlB
MSVDLEPVTFATPGPWTLSVSVPSGTLTVLTHQQASTEVTVEGARDPNDVVVRADDRTRTVSIAQTRRRGFGWFGSGVSLEVVVPEGTALRLKGEALDLQASGRVGPVAVSTASGDVSVQTVDGELRVNSASGDVQADHVTGPVLVRSASGDVQLGRADHDLTVQSASGDVFVDLLRAGRTSVQVVSGDVELGVERGLRLHLELASLSGSTNPDLDLEGDPTTAASDVVALDVRVRTVSGDITIRRARTELPSIGS